MVVVMCWKDFIIWLLGVRREEKVYKSLTIMIIPTLIFLSAKLTKQCLFSCNICTVAGGWQTDICWSTAVSIDCLPSSLSVSADKSAMPYIPTFPTNIQPPGPQQPTLPPQTEILIQSCSFS